MNFNRKALSRIDSFWRSFFNAGSERLEPERDRSFGAKKRPEPKPSVLRLESLEDRALLSVAPQFAVSPASPNPAAVLSEYSAAEPVPAVPDLASALSAASPLQTQAARDAGDLAVVNACGLDADDTAVVKWNSDGRLTYFMCDGSNIAELDLSSCSALEVVYVLNCPNLTNLDISGLQSLDRISITSNACLTDLNLDNIKLSSFVNVVNNNALTEIAISGLEANSFSCRNNAALTGFTATGCQTRGSFELAQNPTLSEIDLQGTTVDLRISDCESVTNLDPDVFSSVRSVYFLRIPIANLDLTDLTALTNVTVDSCANLTSLDLSGLQSLKGVNINGNSNLTDLNLDDVKTSSYVNVNNNGALTEISASGMNIYAFSCSSNASLTSIAATDCQATQGFYLLDNSALSEIDLTGFTGPRVTLEITRCQNVTSLDLSDVAALAIVNVSSCNNLTSLVLPDVATLSNVLIGSCAGLTNLDLSDYSTLSVVNVRSCANLTSLDLSGLQSLSTVSISSNASLTDLNLDDILVKNSVAVFNNAALTELDITGMNSKSFSCHDNTALVSVTATGCQTDAGSVGSFSLYNNPVLTQIDLTDSSVSFDIHDCESMTSLDPAIFSSTKILRINGMPITSLDLSDLPSLISVQIYDNEYLTELNLDNITASSYVQVYNNAALTELHIAGVNASSFSCHGNAALASVTATDCQTDAAVGSFSLYGNPVLSQIDLAGLAVGLGVYGNDMVTSLDLSGLQSLTDARIYNNARLTYLNLDNIAASNAVAVFNNNALAELEITGITASSFSCYNNNALAEFEITGMNASLFSCYNNASLTRFTATDCRTDSGFTVYNNPVLTRVNLSDNPQQQFFNVYGNAAKTLSFSGCSELQFLSCGEDALNTLYIPEESSFELRFRYSDAWNSLVVRDELGGEIPTYSTTSHVCFNPYSYDSNPITAEFYEDGTNTPIRTATIWKGQEPALEFNQYSKTVTAITDKNVVLTRGVVATGIDNPTYTVYIDGVKSTKITVNKTYGQIVYSGGNNGMPARSEPYVVTVTAAAGGKSASADFLLTIANDSKISTTVSTNSPKYNTAVRATVKPAGSAVTYQWYRTKNASPATAVWTAIDGATKSSYVPTSADLGYYLKVMVRGTGANDGHATQAITSGKVTRPIVSVTLPTTVEVNKTLTAFPAPSSATATYQWYRGSEEEGWTAIKNATGLKYVPQLADVGKFLKVTVTGKDNFTGTISKVTGKRVTASLISVTAAGNLKVGSKITSYLSPSAATVTYQWYTSKNGSTWTAITGATDKTYTPTDADAGKYLKVTVKGTGYFKGTVTRTLSGKIAAASTSASAQDAFASYEDAVFDGELDEFWNTLEETLNK